MKMSKKTRKPTSTELDDYENDIEDQFDDLQPYSGHKKKNAIMKAKVAAENYMRKNKRITIRIYDADLNRIKRLAMEEGLPYQTFITSVLHQLSTGRLILNHDWLNNSSAN